MPTTQLRNPVDIAVTSTSVGLQVSGTAAASTSGAGAKPANSLTVAGTPGQATTGSGVAAGAGADITIAAGAGGAAVTGATRGSGGSVTINPGAPATGAGTGGTYGKVMLATEGGRVAIGTTIPTASLEISGTERTFSSTRIFGANGPVTFSARKANTGTTSVANGHEIANFTYSGYDGDSYYIGARIRAFVDGAVTPGNVPMSIGFFTGSGTLETEDGTVVDGDNAVGERLRISSGGNVGIGILSPTSALHVEGGVQIGMPTGGDTGAGTLNVAGEVYVNGAPLLERLEEAHRLIAELTNRAERLETELMRVSREKP